MWMVVVGLVALVSQAAATTLSAAENTSPPPTPGVEAWRSPDQGKHGDKCNRTSDCDMTNGLICDEQRKVCQCKPDLPASNHIDKCGPYVELNDTCEFNEQCRTPRTSCRDGRCSCMFDMTPLLKDHLWQCVTVHRPAGPVFYGDPAMIGVLIGMCLMFIIICIVLRLFSSARWRENRTIFNTPNPRLMNVSLLRENKNNAERRGSKSSNHPPPSRQPSLASLRPQSPANHSQGSRASLRGSRSSTGSVKSPTHHHAPQA